jgi:hypothetical protein
VQVSIVTVIVLTGGQRDCPGQRPDARAGSRKRAVPVFTAIR